MQHVIDKHYQRLAKDYDGFLYYSPQFVRALTTRMIQQLRLLPDDRLVDIGCGTGMYSLDILQQVPLQHGVIGVDPYPEMLAQIPIEAPIERVADDALTFSAKPLAYDKVLVKEAIHHVENRVEFFANTYRNLPPGGILLLVHVPPKVQYPLFDAALERCLNWHANPDELVALLQQAGFRVERSGLDYEHRIPRDVYLKMVQNCYMSVLSSFDESELSAGLAEMQARYHDQPVLDFTDHFDYLTATKVE